MGHVPTHLEAAGQPGHAFAMKIALISPYEYPFPGGVTEHVYHLDRCFRELGHEVKIIAPSSEDGDKLADNVISISESITSIPFSGSISRVTLSPRVYLRVKRLLQQEAFDVVHLHEPLTPLLALVALRHSKSVTVGTFHAYREKPNLPFQIISFLFRPLIGKLDARICVSEAAHELISHYYPGNYLIIPNGIDMRRFGPEVQPIDKYMDGRPNILFVGRLEKRKGFRFLMRAYPYIVEAFPDARLLIVGAYEKEDKEPFVRYARMHNLTGAKFIGRVSSDVLAQYY
jgi:phosphatidylinositol alpha-mannosyltransferase